MLTADDQHVAQRAHGRDEVEGSLHRIGDTPQAIRFGTNLGGRNQADETHPHPLDDEERRRETARGKFPAACHIGG
jgi:hypothetical protein